jgi:hypothetical protein
LFFPCLWFSFAFLLFFAIRFFFSFQQSVEASQGIQEIISSLIY